MKACLSIYPSQGSHLVHPAEPEGKLEYAPGSSSAHGMARTDSPLCWGDHCMNVLTHMDTVHLCWTRPKLLVLLLCCPQPP